MRSCRSISPTDCWDETRRLNIARRFGSAMISNTECILLIYSTEHMRAKVYKGTRGGGAQHRRRSALISVRSVVQLHSGPSSMRESPDTGFSGVGAASFRAHAGQRRGRRRTELDTAKGVTGLTTIAAARFHLTALRLSLTSRVRSIPGPVAPANGSTGPLLVRKFEGTHDPVSSAGSHDARHHQVARRGRSAGRPRGAQASRRAVLRHAGRGGGGDARRGARAGP